MLRAPRDSDLIRIVIAIWANLKRTCSVAAGALYRARIVVFRAC